MRGRSNFEFKTEIKNSKLSKWYTVELKRAVKKFGLKIKNITTLNRPYIVQKAIHYSILYQIVFNIIKKDCTS